MFYTTISISNGTDTAAVREGFCATFKNVDITGKEISKAIMLRFLLEAAELEEKAAYEVTKLEEKVQKFIDSDNAAGKSEYPVQVISPQPKRKQSLPGSFVRMRIGDGYATRFGAGRSSRNSIDDIAHPTNPHWEEPY